MHGVAKSGQNHSFPWCAINPFNGLLYSSPFYDNGGHEVFAYDRASGAWAGSQYTIHLTRPAYRVQGGCFSPRGHLYLASDRAEAVSSGETVTFPSSDVHLVGVGESGRAKRRKFILCYSAFNGQYLGRAFVDALEKRQELEGLCYGPGTVGGHAVQLHVVLLENEPIAKDNAYIKPYAALDAGRV